MKDISSNTITKYKQFVKRRKTTKAIVLSLGAVSIVGGGIGIGYAISNRSVNEIYTDTYNVTDLTHETLTIGQSRYLSVYKNGQKLDNLPNNWTWHISENDNVDISSSEPGNFVVSFFSNIGVFGHTKILISLTNNIGETVCGTYLYIAPTPDVWSFLLDNDIVLDETGVPTAVALITKNGRVYDPHNMQADGYHFESSKPSNVTVNVSNDQNEKHIIVTYINGIGISDDTEVTIYLEKDNGEDLCYTQVTIMGVLDDWVLTPNEEPPELEVGGSVNITLYKYGNMGENPYDAHELQTSGYTFETNYPANVAISWPEAGSLDKFITVSFSSALNLEYSAEVDLYITFKGPAGNLLCDPYLVHLETPPSEYWEITDLSSKTLYAVGNSFNLSINHYVDEELSSGFPLDYSWDISRPDNVHINFVDGNFKVVYETASPTEENVFIVLKDKDGWTLASTSIWIYAVTNEWTLQLGSQSLATVGDSKDLMVYLNGDVAVNMPPDYSWFISHPDNISIIWHPGCSAVDYRINYMNAFSEETLVTIGLKNGAGTILVQTTFTVTPAQDVWTLNTWGAVGPQNFGQYFSFQIEKNGERAENDNVLSIFDIVTSHPQNIQIHEDGCSGSVLSCAYTDSTNITANTPCTISLKWKNTGVIAASFEFTLIADLGWRWEPPGNLFGWDQTPKNLNLYLDGQRWEGDLPTDYTLTSDCPQIALFKNGDGEWCASFSGTTNGLQVTIFLNDAQAAIILQKSFWVYG